MGKITTDVLVIGAGSGGLSVAAGAVQMGARVVLLEDRKMGGDCLNYGCVPSKALIAVANRAYRAQAGEKFGVTQHAPEIDYAAAKDHVEAVIRHIAPVDSQERFEGLGVQVIRARGVFTGPDTVQAGETEIHARRIVVATGSRPYVPAITGIENVDYLTNETLWDLREKPAHLLVVGGGPIGIEMAQAHARLGVRVSILEGARVLGDQDPEMAAVVVERLRGEGVMIEQYAPVERVHKEPHGGQGDICVTTRGGAIFRGSHLLMAVGRRANVEGLGLEAAGVDYDLRGIKVDAGLRSSNRKVYGIGDVAGGMQFTHLAGYHAGVVIRSILFGLPSKAKTHHIPRVIYSDPELAHVGLTHQQARLRYGATAEVYRFPFAENDRAITLGKTTGLIKVVAARGRPLGATIVGEGAGDLIGIWALALANKMKMSQIASMVAPYPTLGEVNKRVAGAYFAPRLFESNRVKRIVGLVQKYLP